MMCPPAPPISPSPRFSPNCRLSTAHSEHRQWASSLPSPFPAQISPPPVLSPLLSHLLQKHPGVGPSHSAILPPTSARNSSRFIRLRTVSVTREGGRVRPHPSPVSSERYHSKAVILGGSAKDIIPKELSAGRVKHYASKALTGKSGKPSWSACFYLLPSPRSPLLHRAK
jgi:hypothetical protein